MRTVKEVSSHRNGVTGKSFYVVSFKETGNGDMIGVIFSEPGNVAVFQQELLAKGTIAFGDNSWRGDVYEEFLRDALDKHYNGKIWQ